MPVSLPLSFFFSLFLSFSLSLSLLPRPDRHPVHQPSGPRALCSAIGQSFIFFTISTFDPLVTTTVTTTRKIFSVLLSIFLHGHAINEIGWAGIGCASLGIIGEMTEKKDHGAKDAKSKK